MKKDHNIFQYISGGCFLIYAVSVLINLFEYGISRSLLFSLIGCVLIAVGLFLSCFVVSAIGCGIAAIDDIITVIHTIGYIELFSDRFVLITRMLLLVSWILLAATLLSRKNAKTLGIVAGIAKLAYLPLCAILYKFYFGDSWSWSLEAIIPNLLLAVGAFFVGFALDPGNEYAGNTSSNGTAPVAASTESAATRLEKLKALLDQGVITQQEFDEKKKQILGL
jgi:hypothetical protein